MYHFMYIYPVYIFQLEQYNHIATTSFFMNNASFISILLQIIIINVPIFLVSLPARSI